MKDKVIGVRLPEATVVQVKEKIGPYGSISAYLRWLIDLDMSLAAFEPDDSVAKVHQMYVDPVSEKTTARVRELDLGDRGPVDIPLAAISNVIKDEPTTLNDGDQTP